MRSVVEDATIAELLRLPAWLGVTTMVTVADPVTVPRLQTSGLVKDGQLPRVVEAETRVTVEGSVSVRITLAAGDGPRLVTTNV